MTPKPLGNLIGSLDLIEAFLEIIRRPLHAISCQSLIVQIAHHQQHASSRVLVNYAELVNCISLKIASVHRRMRPLSLC